ncbi:FxsB family cyclophane-forming radical SAM/SPASM peptide maturase [Limnohabitans sp. WS1]|uniref:FxsB family cyclophane-forming radical SAM/SPASM peptide maturase n=1 Tax=Limnohabitans sp. WS1 TaxID=1100726 RepID=UPI0034CFEDB7
MSCARPGRSEFRPKRVPACLAIEVPTKVTAINEFIVKVASRCNLDCDYCYEYHSGDDSWKTMPKFLSMDSANYLAFRIAEHCREHGLKTVFVTFHGGEPTLAGADRLERFIEIFLGEARSDFLIIFAIQTNATLITDELCELIRHRNIQVSVSVDGNQKHNDLHRLDHRGKSSHVRTAAGIAKLKETVGEQLSGLLAVMDIKTDPLEVFDALAQYGTTSVEFLLPHHNWDKPPPRPGDDEHAYGKWYFEIFKAWIGGRNSHLDIRFFTHILSQLVGNGGIYEAMTLAPITLLTVNTAGGYEAVDCIKSTGSGAHHLGLHVKETSVSSLLTHPAIEVRQKGEGQLAPKCQTCRFKTSCAGGYYPHRYSVANSFNNPSVYCSDLYWLLSEITTHVKALNRHA